MTKTDRLREKKRRWPTFSLKPTTWRQAAVVHAWITGDMRLVDAKRAIRYRGTSPNAIRALYTLLLRAIRSGQVELKLKNNRRT